MGRGTWKPEFQGWDEDKVEMVDEEVTTHSNSRNEYGVAFQMTDTPYTGDGAIFWIDMHHIYFRFDWGHWYKVSTEDLENCAQICKRSSAKLLVCTATSLKHHSIRVYHIKSLPEELFGPQDGARPDACSNGPQREDRDGSAETPEGSDGGASFSLCVMNMGGSPITRYRGNAHRCDIYELNGHLFEGRYSPTNAQGKREVHVVYAKTKEECEVLLEKMIAEIRERIKEEKQQMTKERRSK